MSIAMKSTIMYGSSPNLTPSNQCMSINSRFIHPFYPFLTLTLALTHTQTLTVTHSHSLTLYLQSVLVKKPSNLMGGQSTFIERPPLAEKLTTKSVIVVSFFTKIIA